jgi:hypothetical protein
MPFNKMARDYKSIDLDCRKQEGDSKKANLGHCMACSTINKMEMILKTLRDCV